VLIVRPQLVKTHERWRVALIDPGDFTPAYDLALANGLLKAGHEVRHVGKYGFDEAARPAFRYEHFYRGLNHSLARQLPAPLLRSVKGICHGLNMASLSKMLRNWRPDVVHFQWLSLPLVDRLFLPQLQQLAPLVLTLHDSNPYNNAAGWIMKVGYLAMVHRADAVIVHTAQAEARLAASGLDPGRVYQLPHGLLHMTESTAHKPRSRHSGTRLCLLQFGKIRSYKGVDVLLEALARLAPEERARLHVKIVGQPYLDTVPLQRFVSERGLNATVEFRFDFVDEREIAGLFASADAALFPYREIDASGVAMTAVAHGLPILASAIGGFSELFRDGCEARLVPPGDPAALANVLREWARAPEVLDDLTNCMRIHRSRIPDWTEIGRRTADVYAAAQHVWTGRRAVNKGVVAELLARRSLS
jgi:glycosyltransferase involved in cell wall biosynthesis